jgi:hypothetical protein
VLRTLDHRVQPFVRDFLLALAKLGIHSRITSGRRDRATQVRLWNAYRSGRSKFPAARPGTSIHETGLAFDVILQHIVPPSRPPYPHPYEVAGRIWEGLGLTWGGRFRDPIHFDFRRRRA